MTYKKWIYELCIYHTQDAGWNAYTEYFMDLLGLFADDWD